MAEECSRQREWQIAKTEAGVCGSWETAWAIAWLEHETEGRE